jgi:hypothetical protein
VVAGTGLRLPDGWHPLADGRPVAVLPDPDGGPPAGVLVVVRALDAETAFAEFRPAEAEILLLDDAEVRCRGGVTARRRLLVHAQGQRSVTTEVWCYPGPRPAVALAAVDTGRYAELQPVLFRALRGFRP